MPQRSRMQTVVAIDFAPPRPARRGRRRLLLAGVAALAALLVAGALVTQLLLR